jgi:hypothetical protein
MARHAGFATPSKGHLPSGPSISALFFEAGSFLTTSFQFTSGCKSVCKAQRLVTGTFLANIPYWRSE